MTQNRWVREPVESASSDFHPTLPSLEVVYRTDPAVLAAVLPPPLQPPDEPRVHARVTEIKLEFGEHRYEERVGYFAVDAVYDGQLGEYPMLMPIDLEPAVSISREKFGEPKKLADITISAARAITSRPASPAKASRSWRSGATWSRRCPHPRPMPPHSGGSSSRRRSWVTASTTDPS